MYPQRYLTRHGLGLLFALALLFPAALLPAAAGAQSDRSTFTYLALGDSVARGYGVGPAQGYAICLPLTSACPATAAWTPSSTWL